MLCFTAVELYGAPFGFIDSFVLRALFVSFAAALTFLCYTPFKSTPEKDEGANIIDICLALCSLAIGVYVAVQGSQIISRWTGPHNTFYLYRYNRILL